MKYTQAFDMGKVPKLKRATGYGRYLIYRI